MNSRRIPPTLQGPQQQQQPPPLVLPQSQQQAQRNNTSGVSVPVPAPGTGSVSGAILTPISPGQVVALVRDAWKKAAEDARSTKPDSFISGLTLDLTEKNIPALPDEVIDILRSDVERLAISHNALSSVPARISECSLRYFAARNNAFEEFPLPLCELTSLEFLDLGRNKLKDIPREIAKLVSLKALALQDNRIESIPLSLAGMTTLQRLRLTGNPIKFPPSDVLQPPAGSLVPKDGMSKEEFVERAVTAQIKNFLAQRLKSHSTETMSSPEGRGDDESSENADTSSRVANRRATGRFPIRIRGSDGSLSQAKAQPPPIPGRSHFRAFSQVSSTSSKGGSGIIPLTMGRSRGASVPPKPEPAESRPQSRSSRWEASVPPENGTLSEAETPTADKPKLNRFSNHLRGISYSGGLTLTNPFSPEDHSLQRPFFVRELSALPVRKYKFQAPDPILEVAKGILYSIYQIHLGVQTLMSLTNDGNSKRSSLEMVFYSTNVYFVELEQAIQDFDLSAGTRGARRDHGAMQSAYTTLINAYVHICAKLIASVDLLVDNGDPRYMRTFLMLVYHSIMELRVSLSSWLATAEGRSTDPVPHSPEPLTAITSRPPSRAAVQAALANNSPAIPNTARLGYSARRPGKVGRGMQVKTDIPYRGRSKRVATLVVTSGSAGNTEPTTPPSDDSFTSAVSSPELERNPAQVDMLSSDGDRQFERFFISLKQGSDLILRILPGFRTLVAYNLQKAKSKEIADKWETLLTKTTAAIQQTEILKERLSNLQLRDPTLYFQGQGRANSSPFWTACNGMFGTWAELGDHIKLAVVEKLGADFPPGVIDGLRQISRSMKASIDLMVEVRKQAASMSKSGVPLPTGSVTSSPPPLVQGTVSPEGVKAGPGRIPLLPMTPQSAALGPAFRATKPFGSSP